MRKTTIQISSDTLERLKMIKRHERESYDFVLNVLLEEAEEDILDDDEIDEIKQALENVKKGKVKSIEQVAKEMGIVLR